METQFPNAHELPNSTVRPVSKHVSARSSGNGQKKPRNPLNPVISGKLLTELAREARAVTEANRMILVVSPAGKKRFVRLDEYRT